MRLWSLHPQYLDSKGLVALWREALLAQKVLQGKTRGYTRHPQLLRFNETRYPIAAIATFLEGVLRESRQRGYHFDGDKIATPRTRKTITVTQGQLNYEWQHLLEKLKHRDPAHYKTLKKLEQPQTHPLFEVIPGEIASWEIR